VGKVTSSDLDDDHWATTAQVLDHIDIPQKGSDPDVESWIVSATHTVQSWWKEATDGDISGDLPDTDSSDPNTFEEDQPLLNDAVALLAASEAHESKAQNIRDDEEADRKHVFLERRAESKFDNWKTRKGYGSTDTVQKQDRSPSVGRSSSLIDLGDQ